MTRSSGGMCSRDGGVLLVMSMGGGGPVKLGHPAPVLVTRIRASLASAFCVFSKNTKQPN